MKNKKIALLALGMLILGGVGSIATQSFAQTTSGTNSTSLISYRQMKHKPGIRGTVSAINGTTLTVTSSNKKAGTTQIYTVDVSNAQIHKSTAGAPAVLATVSDIAVGDKVGVQGSVSGTSVTATSVQDGLPLRNMKNGFLGNNKKGQGVMGTVSVINGNTVTIINSKGILYTVDATGATVTKDGVASTLSSIVVGDKIFVKGAVTGTNVVATNISDGHKAGVKGLWGKGKKGIKDANGNYIHPNTNTNANSTQ